MCSKPRIIAPNHIYEISYRGAMGTKIFQSSELKAFFLQELECTLKKFSFKCYAWNVMEDHYHLIVKSSDASVSKFMQRINSIYAKHFNKVTNGSGVVFHKRFASVIIEESKLKKLIRYVHLNPVRSGNCSIDQLASYSWCGHGIILNRISDHFQNVDDVLNLFSGSEPLKAYDAYVKDKSVDVDDDLTVQQIRMANRGVESFSNSESLIIGCADFIKNVLEMDACRRLRVARFIRENMTLDRIQAKIEEYLKLPQGALHHQGRLNARTTARYLFSYIGKFRYDFSMVKLALYLNVSCSTISKMITKYLTFSQRITAIEDLFNVVTRETNLETVLSV